MNRLYAKMIFRLDCDKRMNLYRKLASLLRNDFTLMSALERTWRIESKDGRKPNEPFAIAIRAWMDGLERGFSFYESVSRWVPSSESLMLSVGAVAKLSLALDNLYDGFGGDSEDKEVAVRRAFVPSVFACDDCGDNNNGRTVPCAASFGGGRRGHCLARDGGVAGCGRFVIRGILDARDNDACHRDAFYMVVACAPDGARKNFA